MNIIQRLTIKAHNKKNEDKKGNGEILRMSHPNLSLKLVRSQTTPPLAAAAMP
jgi:hypothetical protein